MINSSVAINELLGCERVDNLRDKMVNLIIERVRDDLENSGEFILPVEWLEDAVNEVIAECKNEIKPLIKEKMYEAAMKSLGIN